MAIPIAVLLAMQAGGMIVDYLSGQDQIAEAEQGAKLQQRAIERSIKLSSMESEEQSISAMKQLRQNLGTQAAALAARGTRAGAGSALLLPMESISNFQADERIRRINQLSKEANLRAGIEFSKMHQEAFANKKENEFLSRSLSRIPTSPEAWKQILGTTSTPNTGFGLTPVTNKT